MSEVLARLRVRETHGIRRFLYPLRAYLRLPYQPEIPLCVADPAGTVLPSQSFWFGSPFGSPGVDFAVSLAPFQEQELTVRIAHERPRVPDELRVSYGNGYRLQQERVSMSMDAEGWLRSVVYDGVEHLVGPLQASLDGMSPQRLAGSADTEWIGPLSFVAGFHGIYDSGGRELFCRTDYEFTACKSWVKVWHTVERAPAGSQITFTLPLRVLEQPLTCDFGIGAGVYAKIAGDGIRWTITADTKPFARWRVTTVAERTERDDYVGEVATRRAFAPGAWCHWVEHTKSLALAMLEIPRSCEQISVSLQTDGGTEIRFFLGEKTARSTRVGVCYHFLNDVPAIAAATNPQSILLPPVVEVLPV